MRIARMAVGGLVVIAAAGLWAIAGPLNPPAGPVTGTYVTLQQIFDRVGGLGSGQPIVPGVSFAGAGTCTGTLSGTPISLPVYAVEEKSVQAFTGPGNAFNDIGAVVITTDMSAALLPAVNQFRTRAQFTGVVVTIPRGAQVWSLSVPRGSIAGVHGYAVPKGDGTVAQLAQVLLRPEPDGTGVYNGVVWTVDGTPMTLK